MTVVLARKNIGDLLYIGLAITTGRERRLTFEETRLLSTIWRTVEQAILDPGDKVVAHPTEPRCSNCKLFFDPAESLGRLLLLR